MVLLSKIAAFLWKVIVLLNKTNVFHEKHNFVKGFTQSKERRIPNAERIWDYLIWIIKNSYFFFFKMTASIGYPLHWVSFFFWYASCKRAPKAMDTQCWSPFWQFKRRLFQPRTYIVWTPVWGDLGPSEPAEIIWEHLGASGSICEHLGAFGSIWEHLGASGSIWEHLGASGNILGYLGASGNIWEHLGASGAIWEDLRASGNIWKHLGTSGNIWEHLGASEESGTSGASGNIWEHRRASGNIWPESFNPARFNSESFTPERVSILRVPIRRVSILRVLIMRVSLLRQFQSWEFQSWECQSWEFWF